MEIGTESGDKLGFGGHLVILCGGFVGALLALPIAIAFYELASFLSERFLPIASDVHRSERVSNFVLRGFVFAIEAGLSVLCARMSLSGYRSRKYKLATIASLIGISIPGALIIDPLISDPLIKEVFDTYVSFFDHTWPPRGTSANLLAIATGFTGAITLLSHKNARTLISAAAIACATLFATAWMASNYGVRFGYMLTLLATQSAVAFVVASVARSHSDERRPWNKFSISDILALTAIVAIATVSFGYMPSAVMLDTKVMYWVFLLGTTVGVISPLLRRSIYPNRVRFVLVAFAAIFFAAMLTTSAFMGLKSLRVPDCHYDVAAGAFAGFRIGYFHWFLLHGVIQILTILAFTRSTFLANRIVAAAKFFKIAE